MAASPESDSEPEEAAVDRLRVDPSIAVFDLESAFNKFFKVVGYRNLQEIEGVIDKSGLKWKGSPKAFPK